MIENKIVPIILKNKINARIKKNFNLVGGASGGKRRQPNKRANASVRIYAHTNFLITCKYIHTYVYFSQICLSQNMQ